jgi:hypothetical protein
MGRRGPERRACGAEKAPALAVSKPCCPVSGGLPALRDFRSWRDSSRERRLGELGAGGLLDREQEGAADLVERPAPRFHREQLEPRSGRPTRRRRR